MSNLPWWSYAIASAVCAAVIPILGKYGLRSINPDVATVVRSMAMTVVLAMFATATNLWSSLGSVSNAGSRALICVIFTGVAGAASWIFYFKALAVGEASKVAPLDKLSVPIAIVLSVLILGDRPSALNWVGVALAVVGIILATLPSQ